MGLASNHGLGLCQVGYGCSRATDILLPKSWANAIIPGMPLIEYALDLISPSSKEVFIVTTSLTRVVYWDPYDGSNSLRYRSRSLDYWLVTSSILTSQWEWSRRKASGSLKLVWRWLVHSNVAHCDLTGRSIPSLWCLLCFIRFLSIWCMTITSSQMIGTMEETWVFNWNYNHQVIHPPTSNITTEPAVLGVNIGVS